MQRNRSFLFLLLLCFTAWHQAQAQTTLVCNDQVFISLDEDCAVTVKSEMILEGTYCCYDDYIVELDKTAPFGNGPWVSGALSKADAGKTYQVRITEPLFGNKCWGTIKVEDKAPPKLNCTGLTTANLAANGTVSLTVAELQVSATDACSDPVQVTLKLSNNQTSVSYDCDDLGVNTLSVTATDAIGNTAACQATVLVADPLNACPSGCVTSCPPAQVVTFEQGVNVLLPAFLAGDTTVFDAYGTPQFDGACSPSDTVYAVTYQPSAGVYSAFVRSWDILLGGNPFGRCEQPILFPFTRTITVSGKVFVDSIQNCAVDAGEIGVSAFTVSVTKFPGNQQISTITPNPDGTYSIDVVVNALDSIVELRLNLPAGISTACPTVVEIPATTLQAQQTADFGLYSELLCPLMEVNIGNLLLRRCFSNNIYWVNYCNKGFQTATGAYVTVQLDSLLTLTSASMPFTQNGHTYTFLLGDVPRFTCSGFYFQVAVSCSAVLGQTLCTEAAIYPHEPCGGGAWAGPKVEARAICEGDSVRLEVRNTGQQDMAEMLDFIVVEDIIMRTSGKFNLKKGEATFVKMPANGATWRIQAEQVTGYPENDRPSATLETCGGLNTPGLVNAFAMNDDPIYYDIDCSEVIGSFDPNDKTATPTGYGPNHIIEKNTDLEYKIRFQNTGTDTAFTVVIADTLSPLLDWASLQTGASSHPYRLDVRQGGILRFIFSPIALPDSNVNEAASHGFVSFRIAQKPDLPIGTVIENKASIYFDFNEAVVTNTAFHTIGMPYIVSSTYNPRFPQVGVEVRPNPFQDQAVVEVTGHTLRDGLLRLYDAQGRAVQIRIFEGNRCKIERNGLLSGTYFFQIMDGGVQVSGGRLQVH